ncbi:MAG: hypothetical protein Q8O88_04090 [bacterium]|nr:hypothetical protein [bacterium]
MDLRKEIRRILLEFFDKPSRVIDKNLGTEISHKYKYPKGYENKDINNFLKKISMIDDINERTYRILMSLSMEFIEQNPELEILSPYVIDDSGVILMGIISGYNPDDILFFITHPGGYSNPSIRNYSKNVHKTFNKFPFKWDGGYLPSPKSFEQIKSAMNNKGLAENEVK